MSFRRASHCSVQALLLGVALLSACSGKDKGVTADGDGTGDGDAGIDGGYTLPPPVCPPENEYCKQAPVDEVPSCGSESIDLTPVGVNVMLAVDGSYAMKNHWDIVQVAIKKMIESNTRLNFGAHLFWANPS
jgi:hypothetical protein